MPHLFVVECMECIFSFFKNHRHKGTGFVTHALLLVMAMLSASCRSSFMVVERDAYERSDSAFARYLKDDGIPYSEHNRVVILNDAKTKFDSLFNDIKDAKHHIHLEYFNFRNDSINRELLELLAQKTKEGVEVRVLFDAFGNSSNNRPLKKKDLAEIRNAGIAIMEFAPIRFPWINHLFARDHRKIAIIDGKKAYTGGVNVADYYIKGIEGIGEWRDTHSKVEGEAVNVLQKIFLDMWYRTSGERIDGAGYYPEYEGCDTTHIAIVDRWPHRTPSRMRDAYANAINSAKESIMIVNPYFIPVRNVRRAIEKAIDDGVKVSILISEKGDIPMIPDGVWRTAYRMMKRGAEVWVYDKGFNHSKVMCVDGSFCTIGSANLNSRSLAYDYETNLFIFGKEGSGELQRSIGLDRGECYKLTKEKYMERCWWRRFCGWLVTAVSHFV